MLNDLGSILLIKLSLIRDLIKQLASSAQPIILYLINIISVFCRSSLLCDYVIAFGVFIEFIESQDVWVILKEESVKILVDVISIK